MVRVRSPRWSLGIWDMKKRRRKAEVTDERVRGKGCRVWRRMEMDGGDVISAASTQINNKSITCDGLKS